MTDLDDLEPPLVRRRIIIETTNIYEVWVEDYDDEGLEALVKREIDSGSAYEYLHGRSPIDGDFRVRAPDPWDVSDSQQHGPWRLCPGVDCQRVEHPFYGTDPRCFEHRPKEAKSA